MSGLAIRLRLWLKLWFRSFPAVILMVLFPVAAYVCCVSLSYRIDSLTGMFYEKAAVLLYVFILQWCFSIDFDSKFIGQLITYPISRWKLIAERALLSLILFAGLLCLVTIGLTPIAGGLVWKGLLFTAPVYLGMGGVVVLAVVIGKHSLGGLFAGLVLWVLSLNGGALLQHASPALLELQIVYAYLNGSLLAETEPWILYNRLFYIGLGLLSTVLAIVYVNRKTD